VESASHLVWGLLLIGMLIVVNAFFVAAEYALVRVRRTRMEAQGDRILISCNDVDRLLESDLIIGS
jgi:CBS domain containing-hemolysin-like protein